MPEKDTNQKAPASKTEKAPTPTKNKSTTRYQIVKNGWGSRTNFQLSYGLRMTPEDIMEGNAILDTMIKNDQEAEPWG